jgi:hypothetical protein
MKIIDCHVHIGSTRFIPREFVSGIVGNIASRIEGDATIAQRENVENLLLAQLQDDNADRLVEDMEEAGIQQGVLLLPDFTLALTCDHTIDEMAEFHHNIRLRHPGRFFVFQGIDPRRGKSGLQFLRRTVEEYGFEGVKLYPPCGYSPSDERLFPFYDYCAEQRLPVLSHTGPTSPSLSFEYSHPHLIDKAAKKYPEIDFILAHGGAGIGDGALEMCAYRPNVYLDISGVPATLNPGGWKKQLSELFSRGINHKILFGTDWPLFRLAGSPAAFLKALLDNSGPMKDVPETELERFMYGNIRRLIKRNNAVATNDEDIEESAITRSISGQT